MNKYLQYFDKCNDLTTFVSLVSKEKPNLKISSIKRRWYDYKNTLDYNKINLMLRVKLKDIIRLNVKITPKLLKDEGFKYNEINYIMERIKWIKK